VSLAHRYHAVLVPRAKRPPPPGSELYLTVPGPTVGALPAHRDTRAPSDPRVFSAVQSWTWPP